MSSSTVPILSRLSYPMSAWRCRLALCFLVLCCVAGPGWSQEPVSSTARLVKGTRFDGSLSRFDGDRFHFDVSGQERVVALPELLLWGRTAEVRKPVTQGGYLLLTDGGLIAGEVTAITAEHVQFESLRRPGLWTSNRLPRTAVRAIVYQASASAAVREQFEAKLLAASETHDRLLLSDGDSLTGALLAAAAAPDTSETTAASVLRFLPPGAKEPLAIAQERIVAVVLGGRAVARAAEPKSMPPNSFWLGLADGSLILANSCQLEDATVTITLKSGASLTAKATDSEVEPPETFWNRVVFVQPLSANVVYLSDLKTIGFKHVPLLDWQQEYANDRSVTHSRLRVAGERSVKGIGMPATSRLAYEIPPGAKQFEAEIALDDAAGRQGSVIFRVFLEGSGGVWKPAFESSTLRGGDPAQSVRVPLGTASRLALVVDMADRGDQCDWANWLNARFVK